MKRGLDVRKVSAGFTIVETLIVLAVTGILFVAIATSWSGRQHKNEFASASNEIRSRIQQTVTDVQNGTFPDYSNFTCGSTNGSAPKSLRFTPGSTKQGTNLDCVFLGKIMQFGYKNSDPQQFKIFSVAGLKSQMTFSTQKPTVVAPAAQNTDMPADLIESGFLQYGMSAVAMKVNDSGTWRDVSAVGFLSRNGSQDAQGGIQNGNQQIDLYAVAGNVNSLDTSGNAAATALNNNLTTSGSYFVNSPVQICFKSGGTDQYALITLGSGNRPLNPELSVVSTSNCGMS